MSCSFDTFISGLQFMTLCNVFHEVLPQRGRTRICVPRPLVELLVRQPKCCFFCCCLCFFSGVVYLDWLCLVACWDVCSCWVERHVSALQNTVDHVLWVLDWFAVESYYQVYTDLCYWHNESVLAYQWLTHWNGLGRTVCQFNLGVYQCELCPVACQRYIECLNASDVAEVVLTFLASDEFAAWCLLLVCKVHFFNGLVDCLHFYIEHLSASVLGELSVLHSALEPLLDGLFAHDGIRR